MRNASIPFVLVGALAVGFLSRAVPAWAQSYWAVQQGKLTAFDVDFETGVSKTTMQAIAPSNGLLLAVAIDPSSDELWASYLSQFSSMLGTWDPGSSSLTPRANTGSVVIDEMAFSADGELYVSAYDSESFIGIVDRESGAATRVLTFPSGTYPSGLAFDEASGDLFFGGVENCAANCVSFVDRLSIPGHARTRVWSFVGSGHYWKPIADYGALLLVRDGFFRPVENGVEQLGPLPQIATALGALVWTPDKMSKISWNRGCWPSRLRACLQKRRFEVEATYDATIFGGTSGWASPNIESDQSLKMSFFDPANLELFLKIIDGCGANGHYWVFVSGLTNAGVALRITDRVTGAVQTYANPAGQAFVPRLDIEAFACN